MSKEFIRAIKRAEGKKIYRDVPIEITKRIHRYMFEETLKEIGYYQDLTKKLEKITEYFSKVLEKLGIIYYWNDKIYVIQTKGKMLCGIYEKEMEEYNEIGARTILCNLWDYINNKYNYKHEKENYNIACKLYKLLEYYRKRFEKLEDQLSMMQEERIPDPGYKDGKLVKTGVLRPMCIGCFGKVVKITKRYKEGRKLCCKCDKMYDENMNYI